MRIFYLLIVLLSSSDCIAQINLDSTYSAEELKEFLTIARLNYNDNPNNTIEDARFLADAYLINAEASEKLLKHRASFEFYISAMKFYGIAGDSSKVASMNMTVAKRYKEAGLYQESEELFQKALTYYQGISDLRMVSTVFSELSDLFKERGDPELEQSYINKAIIANKDVRDTSLDIRFLMDKVDNYLRLNELDSALWVSYRAFELSDNYDDPQRMSEALFEIANINRMNLNYNKAITHYDQALRVQPSIPYDEKRLKIYRALSDTYDRVDDYEKAFMYESRFSELNDSIMQKNRNEALENAAIKNGVEQTKKDMALLEVENRLIEQKNQNQRVALYIMAAGLTLLLILIYYTVRFYSQKIRTEKIISNQVEEINKQKIRELEDEVKINSMESMIEGQELERERIARDLHDSLGGLLSTIKLQFDSVSSKNNAVNEVKEYHKANTLLDTAVAEVRTISHNLQPGALMNLGLIHAINDLINRFDSDSAPEIDFQHYGLPEKMDNMVALSIYRIVQELFNNALKHSKANELLLQINKIDDEIIIQFEDDGIGFDKENLIRKGMGLENIQSRINYLKGNMEIDSSPGEGTSYMIHLQYDK